MVGRDDLPEHLIGRQPDLATALDGLRFDRFVWITGFAGVGRSALAAELARTVAAGYPDGVLRLELTDWDRTLAGDPGQLITELGRTAGLAPLTPEVDELAAALAGKRHLILLDDVDGIDLEPVRAVVRQAPGCAAVVTAVTRPADATGGAVSLGPLPVPVAGASVERAARNSAVQLFSRIAERTDPGYVLDQKSVPYVVSICRSVGGLPLALELAASRTRLLGVALLADKLAGGAAMGVLRPGADGAEAALTWAYRQLPTGAQAVLRRLGYFTGAFSLAAATVVCDKREDDLLEHLTQLVDLHLLQQETREAVDGGSDDLIFTSSPLLREFARSELGRSSELFEVGRLHADYYTALARRAVADIDDARDNRPHLRVRRAWPDLARAEEWFSAQGQLVEALRVAVDRACMATYLGDPIEFGHHLERLRQQAGDALEDELRCDLMLRLTQLRFDSTDSIDALHSARAAWEEGVALAREQGDPLLLIRALRTYAIALPVTGDFDGTGAVLHEGRDIAERIGHVRWLARFEALLGMMHHQQLHFDAAVRYGTIALQRALRAGDRRALITVGVLLHLLPPGVRPEVPLLPSPTEMYRMARDLADPDSYVITIATLAQRAVGSGNAPEAAYWVAHQLDQLRTANVWRGAGYCFLVLAQVAQQVGDPGSAAWFHGIVVSRMSLLRAGMPPAGAAAYERLIEVVRTTLGDETFNQQVTRGSLLSWPEVIDRARTYAERLAGSVSIDSAASMPARSDPASTGPITQEDRSPPRWPAEDQLSQRERQVLALMVDGRTNKEIGASLQISAKTVMHHCGHIYSKLGVRGRAEAAAVAVRNGLLSDH